MSYLFNHWWVAIFCILSSFLASTSSAQWIKCATPYNDYSFGSLAVMGNNLIANCGGEIFRSTDLGATWIDANNGIPYTSDATQLYVFGSDVFVLTAFNIGVAVSEDSGKTWEQRNQPYLNENTIAMISFGDTLIVSQVPVGVWRSVDTGQHWVPIDTAAGGVRLHSPRSVISLAASGGYVYAGCLVSSIVDSETSGVFRSSDGGNTWTNVLPLQFDTEVWCMATMGSNIFAGISSGPGSNSEVGYVYRSTDWGETWHLANNGLPNNAWPTAFIVSDSVIYVSFDKGGGVSRSLDSGKNWVNITSGMAGGSIECLDTCKGYLFAGGQYGLYRRSLSDFDKSGVAPAETSSFVSIFPSVTSGPVTVHASAEVKNIIITNVLGNEVFERKGVNASDFPLDLSELPPGTYFIQITTRAGTVMKKIIRE